jgi:hypothetical protein
VPLSNYQYVAEGLVHFRVSAYDTNGLPMVFDSPIYLTNGYPDVLMTNDPGTLETRYAFTNAAVPAYVEVEMGVLEPRIVERMQSMSGLVAYQYFTNHVGSLHLFRQRIPIRTGL